MSPVFKILLLLFVSVVLCSEEKRLIAFSEKDRQWLPVSEVEKLIVDKVNFIDITDHINPVKYQSAVDPIPVQVAHKEYVTEVLKLIQSAQLQSTLTTLTGYNTRYYTSDTGAAAAKWIHDRFAAIIAASTDNDLYNRTVATFTHTWVQPSIIATIPGWGPNKEQVVIIGAHEDSVGSTSTGRSPGADDDGSGTVAVIEIFRVLTLNGYRPDRTLSFMTYAGEEAGLRGSAAIAAQYAAAKTPVHAVLQLDMIGYGAGSPVGIVTDNVDASVTAFVRVLIEAYTSLTWGNTQCGYGCSDHASWTRNGYRSAFPFETSFSQSNPYIHTANDVISHLSFDRMVEFVKLGVGFAIELCGTVIEK